jgi:predicted nucleic acid-binding protein
MLGAPVQLVPTPAIARQALAFGVLRGISAYDAAYLALAIGTDAVLVTADKPLAEEAERSALLPDDAPPET